MPNYDTIPRPETTTGAQAKVDRHALSPYAHSRITAVKKTVSSSITIPAGYAAYIPDELEIASGITLEIGNGGILEIG